MPIEHIGAEQLRHMKGKEGLVIQGCGGDTQEWLDGMNNILTEQNILLNGSIFEKCFVFSHDNTTCILFPFDDTDLDIGKFAVWRLVTHSTFGGTWLSDYVPNRLGGFIAEKQQKIKPLCRLIGEDGNIFNLMAIASKSLRDAGQDAESTEMCKRITSSNSYHEALGVIMDYVQIGSVNDEETCDMEMNL